MSKLIQILKQKWNNWRNPDSTTANVLAVTRVIDTRDSFMPLTRISGIGPHKAIRMQAAGIRNVEQLIEHSAIYLAGKTGFTVRVCQKYIDCGKELLS